MNAFSTNLIFALLLLQDPAGKSLHPSIEQIPALPKEEWRGLIGEYRFDRQKATVFERAGQLFLIIDGREPLLLTEQSEGRFTCKLSGTREPTLLSFTRDSKGLASGFALNGRTWKLDPLARHDEIAFRIQPQRPLVELTREAGAARPPEQKGEFAKPDLVDLATLDPSIKFDIRYATANNFLGAPVYSTAKAFLQRPAAEALLRVHKRLFSEGYGLLVHDAYRPWSVTKVFWEATPQAQRIFVADPSIGSRHNRGCAVDLTLYEVSSGRAVRMPGGYDEFSDRSYPDYLGGTTRERWHRDKLRRAMEREGFTVFEAEWWHYDFRDWKKYPVWNVPLEKVAPNS